jgi:hypothetical protein
VRLEDTFRGLGMSHGFSASVFVLGQPKVSPAGGERHVELFGDTQRTAPLACGLTALPLV